MCESEGKETKQNNGKPYWKFRLEEVKDLEFSQHLGNREPSEEMSRKVEPHVRLFCAMITYVGCV